LNDGTFDIVVQDIMGVKGKDVRASEFLTDVVLGEGKPVWRKLFDRFGTIFDKHFGPDWTKKNQFLKDFETALRKDEGKKRLKVPYRAGSASRGFGGRR